MRDEQRAGGRVVIGFEELVESGSAVLDVRTSGSGPQGSLPLTAEMLLTRPSGDVFGLTQNAGMGWDPRELGRPQYLITMGLTGGMFFVLLKIILRLTLRVKYFVSFPDINLNI